MRQHPFSKSDNPIEIHALLAAPVPAIGVQRGVEYRQVFYFARCPFCQGQRSAFAEQNEKLAAERVRALLREHIQTAHSANVSVLPPTPPQILAS